jgi:hypothetical protein
MDVSSPSRRRPKRPADDDHSSSSPATSPSSQWIRAIQNESFQPKPTAYSPHSLQDEDPLMLQQRQCRDKLRALRQVRERITFYPLQDQRTASSGYAMKIDTSMILSAQDAMWQNVQSDGRFAKSERQHVGIEALGGLEMLLFNFFSRQELIQVSGVCRAWRTLARDDLFWEPLLLTPLERYPLRPLLGLERDSTRRRDDVPAILVYMVFQRLKIAQAAHTDCSDVTEGAATPTVMAPQRPGRLLELFQTLNRQQVGAVPSVQRVARDGVASVHLVSLRNNPLVPVQQARAEQEVTQMAAELNLEAQRGNRVAQVRARNNLPLAHLPLAHLPLGQVPIAQQHAAVNAANGAADDEDVYSVADGRNVVTLSSWLSTKRRVSERTLRSFLRQMLLAVDALERSNCEHTDVSAVSIVVHSLPRSSKEDNGQASATSEPQGDDIDDEEDQDEDEGEGVKAAVWRGRKLAKRRTPLFQLFLSRRNYQHTGGIREQALPAGFVADADVNLLDADGLQELAHQRQRLADAEADAGAAANGNGAQAGGGLAAFRNRLALPHASMVSSVIQTAMTVWARGRFVDANASSLLTLLLLFPDSFPSGLRAFLEHAKYLVITHTATAAKLLRHNYLRCSGAELSRQPPQHWATRRISDVNEYKSKLVAYYGSLPSRMDGLLDDNASSCASPAVIDELMPRTSLGTQYFVEALKEGSLPAERFVSVVAPSTASSSWVHKLACTQTCTLQRLDLSRARVPMSVLLRELVTLPRLTHLRLPRQILRDENLEHLVAALAYGNVLPNLRGLDENVRQAMDRMEKSYLMQLDMVTFLLQKPSAASSTGARPGV